MTVETHDHQADCLMCAVRALTEGAPNQIWTPTDPGSTVSGVVLRQGEVTTNLGSFPFVDLWQGGTSRIRVMAYGARLRHALSGAAAQIGDRLQIWFDGEQEIPGKSGSGPRVYKAYSVNVHRGH